MQHRQSFWEGLAEGGLLYIMMGLIFLGSISYAAYSGIMRHADWQISGFNEEAGAVTLEKWWGADEEIARAWWSDKDETWYYEDPDTGQKQAFDTEPPDYPDYEM